MVIGIDILTFNTFIQTHTTQACSVLTHYSVKRLVVAAVISLPVSVSVLSIGIGTWYWHRWRSKVSVSVVSVNSGIGLSLLKTQFLKQTSLHSISLILHATLVLFSMNILPPPIRFHHFLSPAILISVNTVVSKNYQLLLVILNSHFHQCLYCPIQYQLDHCIDVYYNLPESQINWRQQIQKCVHGAAPAYLQELCVLVKDVWERPRLWSASARVSAYSLTEGEDVNNTAKVCVQWAASLEQFDPTAASVQLHRHHHHQSLKTRVEALSIYSDQRQCPMHHQHHLTDPGTLWSMLPAWIVVGSVLCQCVNSLP